MTIEIIHQIQGSRIMLNNCFEINKIFYYRIIFLLIVITTFPNHYSQTLTAEKIYKTVSDAVVVIYAYDYNNELTAQGSGVVINDKGYVVTNYHVLSGNERLEIMHGEEITPYVDIIGIDVEKDILILKIDENKFPSVKIGDVKSLKVGQRVYAIGSPLGFENTISEGIISGLRSFEEDGKNFIQITASISSGSSGGAVVNDKGELIGISTLTAKEGQNLNFAIPINEILTTKINSYSKDEAYKEFEWFSKADEEYDKGNYEEAILYYTIFIKKFPKNEIAYYNRGIVKIHLSDFQGAIQDFNETIKINTNYNDAYSGRGFAKYSLGDVRGAIKDYDKAIEILPTVDALIYRGETRSDLGDFQGSIQDFNKAIELNPNDWFCYYKRGNAKAKIEDHIGAIEDFNKVIEIEPENFPTYISRGRLKLKLGDKNGACLDWSKAGELGDSGAYDLIKEYCN